MSWINKENKVLQWIIILAICIFGCGAYFVYDAPASLMNYIKPAMGYSSSKYMDLYTYYSMPNIVSCILGGVLIDNFLGRRLGGIVFCAFIFVGQLIFATGIRANSHFFAICGRVLIGMGVETLAVCSNCYLTWWFDGKALKPLAFGLALSIWRLSSSLSFATMMPLYNDINSVTPVPDGLTPTFKSCSTASECEPWKKTGKGGEFEQVAPSLFDKTAAFDKEGTYYCYDSKIMDTCTGMTAADTSKWILSNKTFCNFNTETDRFISDAGLRTHGCLVNNATHGFHLQMDRCNCLDSFYVPSYELYSEFTENPDSSLDDPWYWFESFGQSASGEDFLSKHSKMYDSFKGYCEKEYQIPKDFVRYDPFKGTVPTDSSIKSKQMIQPEKYDIQTVGTWSTTFNDNNPYTACFKEKKDGGDTNALLVSMPQVDIDERRNSVSVCYYVMSLVSIFSLCMAGFLFFIDGKAERAANEAAGKSADEDEKEPFSWSGLLEAAKSLNVEVIALYMMCVCFYCGVFIFVSQAPQFFESHSGLTSYSATFAASVIYQLAVPFNPIFGAILSKVGNSNIFLCVAFMFSTMGHVVMYLGSGAIAAFGGMALLAVGYALIGTTMWPLAGALVPDNVVGKVYGLMYAFQQLGLTCAAWASGILKEKYGWGTVEIFYILLEFTGFVLGVFLVLRLGPNAPEKKKAETTEEGVPLQEQKYE